VIAVSHTRENKYNITLDEILDITDKLDMQSHSIHKQYTVCEVLREVHKMVQENKGAERRIILAMLFAKRMDRALRKYRHFLKERGLTDAVSEGE
jgi:hypothetical protein